MRRPSRLGIYGAEKIAECCQGSRLRGREVRMRFSATFVCPAEIQPGRIAEIEKPRFVSSRWGKNGSKTGRSCSHGRGLSALRII
jgi:hypothetical protein